MRYTALFLVLLSGCAHNLNTFEGRMDRSKELIPHAAQWCEIPESVLRQNPQTREQLIAAGGTQEQYRCVVSFITRELKHEMSMQEQNNQREAEIRAARAASGADVMMMNMGLQMMQNARQPVYVPAPTQTINIQIQEAPRAPCFSCINRR